MAVVNVGVVASGVLGKGFKVALGNVARTAAGTATIVITTTAAIAVGDLVVVRVASDNLNATTPTFTCADSGGNTYTVVKQQAANATGAAGVAGAILATKATSVVNAGGTITITMSATTPAHAAAYAESFTGFDNTMRSTAVSTGSTGTASTVTSGSATAGDLVVGAVAIESRAVPSAYDTDTVNGSWSAGFVKPSATSGTDTSCVEVAGQHKIVTATAAQTYNLTNANTDWAALIAVFQATP